MKTQLAFIATIAILAGAAVEDAHADLIVVQVDGNFATSTSGLFGSLPPSTFPFPLLLGGTFSGTYTYDTDIPPVGPLLPLLSADIDIIDSTGAVIHTIDSVPNQSQVATGFFWAHFGETSGPEAINLPEDLRLRLDGPFVFGVTPDESSLLAATSNTLSFIEVDGPAGGSWDLTVLSFTVDVSCGASLASVETPRPGFPPNPFAFLPGVTSGPVVGGTWDPVIDHTTFFPGALVDIVGIALGPASVPLPPYGTVLCDFFSFPPYTFQAVPGLPFVIDIPLECNLIGASFCTQGLSSDGLTNQLTNALDITIGTF